MDQNQTLANWEKLRNLLIETAKTPNVYYNPPSSIRLSYPCIIFSLDAIDIKKADNIKYSMKNRYSVNYISRSPDEEIIHEILNLQYTTFERTFCAEGLYHTIYNIYF